MTYCCSSKNLLPNYILFYPILKFTDIFTIHHKMSAWKLPRSNVVCWWNYASLYSKVVVMDLSIGKIRVNLISAYLFPFEAGKIVVLIFMSCILHVTVYHPPAWKQVTQKGSFTCRHPRKVNLLKIYFKCNYHSGW